MALTVALEPYYCPITHQSTYQANKPHGVAMVNMYADFKSEISLEEGVIASESKHDFDVPISAAPKSKIDNVKPISYQLSIIFCIIILISTN